jgi:hypothetical protein
METEYDFSNAWRAKDVPHLTALRAKERGVTALKQAIDPASAPVTLGQLQAALSQWSHNSTSTKQS